MKIFDHVGIITAEPQPGESWVPFSRVWVTNPRLHPQRIEYIRPLEFPQVDPAQVVHVNAHATSTPGGDPLEAMAIQAALGQEADGVVVSATKSMTGHLLGGAGAIESVASIMALVDRMAPPTINLDDLDEDVPVEVAVEPRPLSKRGSEPMAVLKNAFGFGGHNVSLVFTAA